MIPLRRWSANDSKIRKTLAALVALAIVAAGCTTVDDVPPLERRANALNKTIMCPICPGESIDQAQNTLAVQMRSIVRDKLDEGWTDDHVRDFFIERYGPSVVLEPPREGFGLVAWLVPPASLVAAGVAFFAALRWMRRRTAEAAPDDAGAPEPSDAELRGLYQRIEAALGYDTEEGIQGNDGEEGPLSGPS